MSIFRVLSFCYLICIAFAQVEVQTSVITATPVTPLQSSSASFQYPRTTETLVINVVDTVVVQWESNFVQNAFLYLWCDIGVPGAPNYTIWANPQVNTTGTSELSPSLYVDKAIQDWTRPYDCHLDLTYEDDYRKNVPGPHFNVTSVANQEITRTYANLYTMPPISPNGVSSGTTMSNTINALSSPTSNVASQPAASSNNDTKLSTGATAGIAVGAIIGFIVLAVLGFMFWRKRKVDKLPAMVHGNNSSMHQDEFISSQSRYKDIHRHQNIPAELEPHSEPQELPGSYLVASNHSFQQ